MKNRLAEMLTTQDILNEVAIGKNWQNSDKDWNLAILVECVEGIDHLGWKWWAKQEPNKEAAKVEVVDILHFALSALMVIRQRDSIVDIAESLAYRYEEDFGRFVHKGYTYNITDMSAMDLFRLCAGMAAEHVSSVALVLHIGGKLGMSFADIHKLYLCKATLNIFRQHNGYKGGTYIKQWAPGKEDNDIMQGIAAILDWTKPEISHTLYHLLADKYALVTGAK